jgi:adenosylhomocysteine nucleosidase
MSGHLLVCFAVAQEAAPFRKRSANSPNLRVLVTGMGRRNAARVADSLSGVSHVITCGFAGALDPSLNIGDVLFETDDVDMCARLTRAGARKGAFYCSETIATTAASKADLFASSKAQAVEMESRVIHDVCRAHQIPCTTVRSISDLAREDLPLDFNHLLTPDQVLSPWKLSAAIARCPHKIPALVRLGRNSSIAAKRLADVLCSVI